MAGDCVVVVDVGDAALGWRGDETHRADDEGHWNSRPTRTAAMNCVDESISTSYSSTVPLQLQKQ